MNGNDPTGIPPIVPPWLAAEPPGRREFLAGFRQSRRGNLFHPLPEGGVAVVFRYKTDTKTRTYGWLVSRDDDGETLFSPCGYARRREALAAVAEELGY
jgi:hypothetical protein